MVVSICAPCPLSTRRPTPRPDRSCTVLTRWARLRPRLSSFQTTSTSPVQSARRQLSEPRAVVADAGREVVVDVAGVDARGPQRVALQVQRLGAVRL